MSFVIACSKIWDRDLLSKLRHSTNAEFHLITEKDQLSLEFLRSVGAQKIFFPHWSYIIKKEIFSEFECVIFHMTDLPYGRGGSPLQNLIIRGHKDTMISALRCTAGLDEGPIYGKRPLILDGSAREIFVKATEIILEMIIEIIQRNPQPVPQVGDIVLFERRKPQQSNLDGISDINKIYDHIRMLDADGYPSAYLEQNGIRFEFHSAKWNGNELEVKARIFKNE